MNLKELLLAVRDEKLPLVLIEKYRDEMIHLHSDMQIALADIEKAEALYFVAHSSADVSDISIKRKWRVEPQGQQGIQLNRELKALAKEIDSLKSRVYRLI